MKTDSEFYENLLDILSDGVYAVDRDRRITYWNRGAERLTGYKSSEVVGKCCRDILMHQNEQGIALCTTEGCLAAKAMTEEHTYTEEHAYVEEVYLRHKDGRRMPILTYISPIRDSKGRIVGAFEIFCNLAEIIGSK